MLLLLKWLKKEEYKQSEDKSFKKKDQFIKSFIAVEPNQEENKLQILMLLKRKANVVVHAAGSFGDY